MGRIGKRELPTRAAALIKGAGAAAPALERRLHPGPGPTGESGHLSQQDFVSIY